MSTQISKSELNPEILGEIVLKGDLSSLQPEEKVEYYRQFCTRLGLDPATHPFQILKLNGRETLYATRACAAQLNKRDGVSHTITSRETVSDCYVVTVRATAGERHEESIGAVSIANLKGEQLCNAMMKAETKGKRRSTLDLCGLGMLDESELGDWSKNGSTKQLAIEDTRSINAIIAQHTAEIETATPERKKELLGLIKDLRCKLADQSEETKPTNAHPMTSDSDWREIMPHVGTAAMLGHSLGVLFKADRAPEFIKLIVSKVEPLKTSKEPRDAALVEGVREALAYWKSQQKPASEPEPKSATTTPPAPKSKERGTAAATDWREFGIESKNPRWSGKKLGDLTATELVELEQYAAGFDKAKLTLKQKSLCAMIALAVAESPHAGVETADPAPHIKELAKRLTDSKISVSEFLIEAKRIGWIEGSDLDSITEAEAKQLTEDWESVEVQFDHLP